MLFLVACRLGAPPKSYHGITRISCSSLHHVGTVTACFDASISHQTAHNDRTSGIYLIPAVPVVGIQYLFILSGLNSKGSGQMFNYHLVDLYSGFFNPGQGLQDYYDRKWVLDFKKSY